MPALLILCLIAFTAGCARLHQERRETVYVWTRQIYLRDRVAAVSNRVAEVVNGQQLEVLEHGRRFLKVKTEKNEIGWIPDRAVIDSKSFEQFAELASHHKDDPVVATGTLRDEMYLHVSPGRETDRFYLLPENGKVQMLVRASMPKNPPPAEAVKRAAKPLGGVKGTGPVAAKRAAAQEPVAQIPVSGEVLPGDPETPPAVMEDWWLVRDGQGHSGWVLGNRVDVDAPDDIAQYAEGQRIVGAYVIARVNDPEAAGTNHEIPEYVTALSPPKPGLLFDFDQIRLFTWSLKHHRYETAYRLHPIQGYLPVRITSEPAPGGTEPVFSFQISGSPNVAVDPDTGIARPAVLRTISYALRETQVRRVGADMAPIPITHEAGAKGKEHRAKKPK